LPHEQEFAMDKRDFDLLPAVHRPAKRFAEEFLTFNFTRKAQSRYDQCPKRDVILLGFS
jgi:hypothetical protein